MKPNLEILRTEIPGALETEGFVVFHGYGGPADSADEVEWDTKNHPEYTDFIAVARKLDVKLIVFRTQTFSGALIEQVEEDLEELGLPSDERREYERRLKDTRVYEGFTCGLELGFSYDKRSYVFELHTEWYREFLDLSDEVDSLLDVEEDTGRGPIGGYFSRN